MDEYVFIEVCLFLFVFDDILEGKFIIELGCELGLWMCNLNIDGVYMIKFIVEIKCLGINLKDGIEICKGVFDVICKIVLFVGNFFLKEMEDII